MDVSESSIDFYPAIPKMTDSELAAKLRELNFDIGPVNNFTRSVYAHKLERVLLEQTSLELVLTPGKRPWNTGLEADSPGEMYIEEGCKDTIQATNVKGGFAHSTPLDVVTAAASSKEKFGSTEMNKASENIAKPFPEGFNDVNAPSSSRRGKRKPLPSGLSESCGVSSLAAAAGQTAPKSVLGLENDVSHVRQRTVVSNSDEDRNTKFYETCARCELKPEDLLPSPRPPLQSYLQRISGSPPSRSDDLVTSSSPSAPLSKIQNPPETVSWWNGAVAIIVIIAVILFLLVFFNMDAGYNSPI